MKIFIIPTVIILGFMSVSEGQVMKYKAIYIYNFARHIEWPAELQNNEFEIGIFMDDELADEISKTFAGKSLGNQILSVRKFNSVSQITPCHILYIGSKVSEQINQVLLKTQNHPTLIITDKEGMIQKGACINFIYKQDKVLFELNKQALQARRLKSSTYLDNLAIIVNQNK